MGVRFGRKEGRGKRARESERAARGKRGEIPGAYPVFEPKVLRAS